MSGDFWGNVLRDQQALAAARRYIRRELRAGRSIGQDAVTSWVRRRYSGHGYSESDARALARDAMEAVARSPRNRLRRP